MYHSDNGTGTSSFTFQSLPLCSPLKEMWVNETDLMKLPSIRNSIFKMGKNGQESPCCHLAVTCGADAGLWLDPELSTAEV